MSRLKAHEKVVFERLFDRDGYVLDFNNQTYAEFFRENGIDIDNDKYQFNGTSKMKRLRAFWEIEPDDVVEKVMEALLQYACVVENVNEGDRIKAIEIIHRLQGKNDNTRQEPSTEQTFLKQEFSDIDWVRLNIDVQLQPVLEQRIKEIGKTLNAKAALAAIFLCGSTLEGLLQDAASKNPQQFNQAQASPKDNKGKVNPFHQWTLATLINVAYEVGLLSLDVKKHSLSLKDFRNYIHPRQQAVQNFMPDMHTARISWQVLQATIADMSKQRK